MFSNFPTFKLSNIHVHTYPHPQVTTQHSVAADQSLTMYLQPSSLLLSLSLSFSPVVYSSSHYYFPDSYSCNSSLLFLMIACRCSSGTAWLTTHVLAVFLSLLVFSDRAPPLIAGYADVMCTRKDCSVKVYRYALASGTTPLLPPLEHTPATPAHPMLFVGPGRGCGDNAVFGR